MDLNLTDFGLRQTRLFEADTEMEELRTIDLARAHLALQSSEGTTLFQPV